MNRNDTADQILWLTLRESLELLASDADAQLASLPSGCDKPFELADETCNACNQIVQSDEYPLTEKQRDSLVSIERFFDSLSGPSNKHLWTENAVAESVEWRRAREMAKHALQSFDWSSDANESAATGLEELSALRNILAELQLPADKLLTALDGRATTLKESVSGAMLGVKAVTRVSVGVLSVRAKLKLLRCCLLLERVASATDQDLLSRKAVKESPEWEWIRSDLSESLQLLD